MEIKYLSDAKDLLEDQLRGKRFNVHPCQHKEGQTCKFTKASLVHATKWHLYSKSSWEKLAWLNDDLIDMIDAELGAGEARGSCAASEWGESPARSQSREARTGFGLRGALVGLRSKQPKGGATGLLSALKSGMEESDAEEEDDVG